MSCHYALVAILGRIGSRQQLLTLSGQAEFFLGGHVV
jgi:hypothetical protein